MTPFEWTRRRLHTAAASVLVILAAEFLKWQNPATAFRESITLFATGIPQKFATQIFRAISR